MPVEIWCDGSSSGKPNREWGYGWVIAIDGVPFECGFGGGPHSILAVGYDPNDGPPNPSMIEAKELDSNDQASFVITGPGTTDVYFYLDKGKPESMNIANGFDAAARAYPVAP